MNPTNLKNPQSLTSRSAIITGGSQGLGLAIARAFVDAGASVLICARDADMLEQARYEVAQLASGDQKVVACVADVSDRTDVDRLVTLAHRELPSLQILVNNAGIYGPIGATEDVDWDAWVQALQVNVLGSVMMCRALIPHFRRQRYGKIIQLSGGGATNPLPRLTAYAASKAAIVRFAESLALELAGDHIDVNAVAPGALNTRMMRELLDAGPAAAGEAFFHRMKQIADGGATPLDTGAALAVYLASAESDGITGRLLSAVWDPWETMAEHRAELAASDVYTLRRITPADRGLPWDRK